MTATAPNPPPAAVRPATRADVPELVAMIGELAEYERARHQVEVTAAHLHATMFAARPTVFGLVAEAEGRVAGMAVWFLSFSTWLGTHSLYLEDLYVRPTYRGRGVGRLLLAELAGICLDRGYRRLEWWVLDWNPARDFYAALGADALTEWVPYRLHGDALARLAGQSQRGGADRNRG